MDYALIGLAGSNVISLIVGYYVGQRGLKGVQNDLGDVKNDISNLKAKISAPSS